MGEGGLPPFAIPHPAEYKQQGCKRQKTGEQRQAVDAFELGVGRFAQADPVIAAGGATGADGHDGRNPHRTIRRRPDAVDGTSVSAASGCRRLAVEMLSANSGASTGPTWASASRSPFFTRKMPISSVCIEPSKRPGLLRASLTCNVLPDGVVTVAAPGSSPMVWRRMERARPLPAAVSASSSSSGSCISQWAMRR